MSKRNELTIKELATILRKEGTYFSKLFIKLKLLLNNTCNNFIQLKQTTHVVNIYH